MYCLGGHFWREDFEGTSYGQESVVEMLQPREEETKFNGEPRDTKEPIMSFECSHQEVPGNPGVSWVLTRLKGEA